MKIVLMISFLVFYSSVLFMNMLVAILAFGSSDQLYKLSKSIGLRSTAIAIVNTLILLSKAIRKAVCDRSIPAVIVGTLQF